MKSSYLMIISTLALIGMVIAYEFQPFGGLEDLLENIFYLLPPLAAAIIGIQVTNLFGPVTKKGKAFFWITLGIFSFFIGEVIWFIYDYYLEVYPYPSVADIFYLLGYPFIFYGLLLELRSSKANEEKFITPLVVTGFGLLAFFIALLRIYSFGVGEVSILENVIALFYTAGDIALLLLSLFVLLLSMEYKGGAYARAWKLFFAAVIFTLIADVLFALFTEEYEIYEGLVTRIDYFWSLGYYFFGLSLYIFVKTLGDIEVKLGGLKR